jgi:hypothetical protein
VLTAFPDLREFRPTWPAADDMGPELHAMELAPRSANQATFGLRLLAQ